MLVKEFWVGRGLPDRLHKGKEHFMGGLKITFEIMPTQYT